MAKRRLPGYNAHSLGIAPLAYMGVNPSTPPNLVIEDRNPTIDDLNSPIGTFWVTRDPDSLWVLIDIQNPSGVPEASWAELYPGSGGGATDFITDSGTATEAAGELNVIGKAGSVVLTEGAGNTVSIDLDGTDLGYVLAGTGGASQPAYAHLTSADGSITIDSSTPNVIDFAFSGTTGDINKINADVGFVQPVGGEIEIVGDGVTTATAGSGTTLSVHVKDGSQGQLLIGKGSGVAPIWNDLTSANATIDITPGVGTLDIGLTNGTNGQLLIGGGAAPTWSDITAGAGISITPGANALTIASTGSVSGASFFAYQPTTSAAIVASDLSIKYLGAYVALTTAFDTAGAFYPGDGAGAPATFTAPSTGNYFFTVSVTMGRPASTSTCAFFAAVISRSGSSTAVYSRNPFQFFLGTNVGSASSNISLYMNLTIGDVVQFGFVSQQNSRAVWGSQPVGTTATPGLLTFVGGHQV